MNRTRRVILACATSVAFIAGATIAAVAAGGGFGQAPGQYSFSDTSAFVNATNPVDQSNLFLSVDRGTFLFKPKGGGGFQRQQQTVLNITIQAPGSDPTQPPTLVALGCFIVNPTAFVVSGDLQSASLKVTVNAADSCFVPMIPVLGSVPVKDAGSGGGNFGFTYPLTVSAAWTGTGATSISTSQGRFVCQTFTSISHTTQDSALSSSVAVTVSGFSGYSNPLSFGNVNQINQTMQVTGSGIITPACGGPVGG